MITCKTKMEKNLENILQHNREYVEDSSWLGLHVKKMFRKTFLCTCNH